MPIIERASDRGAPGKPWHLSRSSPTELVQDVIAEYRERTGEHTVEFLHRCQQSRVSQKSKARRQLGGTITPIPRRFSSTNQGAKALTSVSTAMIHNREFTFGESCRYLTAPEAPKRLIGPSMEQFSDHLAGAEKCQKRQASRRHPA